MRLLMVSSLYRPDNAPDSKRAGYLADELTRRGHTVRVLTALPHYSTGCIAPAYRGRLLLREAQAGAQLVRSWVYARPSSRARDRLLNWLTFFPAATLASVAFRGRYDVVLSIWPPFSAPLAAALQAFVRRGRLVHDVQDIYPDTAIQLGQLKGQALSRAAQRLERFIYARADRVVVISDGFRTNLESKGVPSQKLRVIPNSVDIGHFSPGADSGVRRELGIGDKFLAMYAGNIGEAQALTVLLDAARELSDRSDIAIVVVGDGTQRGALEERVRREGLGNVTLVPAQPFAIIPRYLRAADALVVHLRRNPLYSITIPSKVAEYMAVGKPLVVGVAGDAAELIRRADCGLTPSPEDPGEMARAIAWLADNRTAGREMGARGASYARHHLSAEAVSSEYADLLESLVRTS